MSRLPRLSLQGWLLTLILPVLGVLAVANAAYIYFRLYDIAIAGFEKKLTDVSTTTAAFIDPADHHRLMAPLPITSMTHDAAEQTIWALDISRHELMKIRPSDGMAEETGVKLPPEIDHVETALRTGELFLVDSEAGHFLHFSMATGKITPAFDIDPPISAEATVMRRHSLYVAGRDLRVFDLATGRIRHLNDLSEPISDLTYDRKRNIIWGLSERGDALLGLDPSTGAVVRRVKLAYEKPADGSEPPPVEIRTLAFERIGETLLGSTTSLVRIDPETGIVSDQGFLPSFGQEQGPIYRRYAGPMQCIMARAHLTYLYTQIVWGRNHINYGLDGTLGVNHSPLLSADILPDSEIAGIQRLMTEGSVYVSGIQPWQQWGLLKSAFTPIFDETGRPVAMAGADIDISTIEFETRRALVISFAFGGTLLLLGGLLALSIARGLTGPLAAIKTSALRAAAGAYEQRAEVARPRELSELARRFSSASTALGRQMRDLGETISARRAERERAALTEQLARVPLLAAAAADSPWAWGATGQGPSADGAVRRGDRILAWLADPGADPLATAVRRATIATTADALLGRHAGEPQALGAALDPLFPAEVAAWALISPEGWRVAARRPSLLFRRKLDRSGEAIVSPSFATLIRPAPGEVLGGLP